MKKKRKLFKSSESRRQDWKRYRANRNAGRTYAGYLANLQLLQDVFLHLGLLTPQIEDHSAADIKRALAAHLEDWEAGCGDAFSALATRNRAFLAGTSTLVADAFVIPATCSAADLQTGLSFWAWPTNLPNAKPASSRPMRRRMTSQSWLLKNLDHRRI
jgi:hypothetical protein